MSARTDIFLHRLHLFEGCTWIPKLGPCTRAWSGLPQRLLRPPESEPLSDQTDGAGPVDDRTISSTSTSATLGMGT